MGKTRDLFKKIRDTKGTFHAKMGSIMDYTTNLLYYHFKNQPSFIDLFSFLGRVILYLTCFCYNLYYFFPSAKFELSLSFLF